MRIFLAGPFSPDDAHADWRDYVKERAPNHTYHDPRFDSEQFVSLTFVRDDILGGVESSDLVFVHNPRGNYGVDPYGLCIELGVAFGRRVPIVYCDENDWIFPMLPLLARRLFTKLDLAVEYLHNLTSLDAEFQTFYDIIGQPCGKS